MTATNVPAATPTQAPLPARSGLRHFIPSRNQWGRPWFLEGFTWLT